MSRERAGTARGEDPFYFTFLTDLHLAEPACEEWLEIVWRDVERRPEAVELLLVGGDLTDTGQYEELRRVRLALDRSGLPYYPVIGNHDHDRDGGSSSWDAVFPERRNYGFEHRGWRFLGLDSTEGGAWENTAIRSETLDWVGQELASLSSEQPLVVFTHFPLHPAVPMCPLNAESLLRRFAEHSLHLSLSGHFHGASEHARGKTRLLTAPCCSRWVGNHDGSQPRGYFLCRAGTGSVQVSFCEVGRENR